MTAFVVAGALTISACGGRSHTATPAGSSTHAPSSTSPTPGVSGGPVPRGTKATSVTFISSSTGFVLGTARCEHAPCSVVLRTRNRGRTWEGLPAPREAVSAIGARGLWGLRFADGARGYAYGRGLWETVDGGRTWRRSAPPATIVLALAAIQDRELVAVAASCLPAQSHCADRLTLYRRPVSTGGWTVVASTRTHSLEAAIAVHESDVWAAVGATLYVSTDAGISFRSQPPPCGSPGTDYGISITDDGPHTYLLCSGGAAAGSVAKYLYRTTGRASSWTLVGQPPRSGAQQGLSAGSDSAVVIAAASGASWLFRSSDGGHSWRTVLTENDGGVGWADLGFTTNVNGVVVEGPATSDATGDGHPGQLLLTDDAGRTWRRVAF